MISISSVLKRRVRQTLVLSLVFLGFSCASTKPPTEEMARTEAAINQADQVGAQDYAPLALRNARKKYQEAKDLVDKKKYKKAKRMAERAEVDAKLAEKRSLSEKAQNAVKQLHKSIKILKQEIQQNQQNQ